MADSPVISAPASSSFVHRRINRTTFLIIEDDDYGEHPHIYIKVYSDHLMITDTGCNSPRRKGRSITSLRKYIETQPLALNDFMPLNPDGRKGYIIVCSHCHYDHILGLPQFLDSNPTIIASGHWKDFILKDLPTNSLCRFIDVKTPKYTVSHWAQHMEYFSLSNVPLRIQFLHIPGHTPDSLAWYDIDEHHLYVGDTFYERTRTVPIPEIPDGAGQAPGLPATQAAIIFPEQGGDWIAFMASLDILLSFVLHQNRQLRSRPVSVEGRTRRVKVACGHLTYDADAEDMIIAVTNLFRRIIAGKVPVTRSGERRGVVHDYWLESEESKFSVMAPRHLAIEARKHFHPGY